MCNKTKCSSKIHFYIYFLQCFSSERVFTEHKEICWKLKGEKTVKLRSGSNKY